MLGCEWRVEPASFALRHASDWRIAIEVSVEEEEEEEEDQEEESHLIILTK